MTWTDFMDSDFTPLQDAVGEWAEATFPKSTVGYCLTHLEREVKELDDSFMDSSEGDDCDAEELADCFLILLHLAHKTNVSLFDEARKKFAKNQTRTWGEPDADGVVEHIAEGQQ